MASALASVGSVEAAASAARAAQTGRRRGTMCSKDSHHSAWDSVQAGLERSSSYAWYMVTTSARWSMRVHTDNAADASRRRLSAKSWKSGSGRQGGSLAGPGPSGDEASASAAGGSSAMGNVAGASSMARMGSTQGRSASASSPAR
eukprot:9092305-Pyramimonas_sp.AAC.1